MDALKKFGDAEVVQIIESNKSATNSKASCLDDDMLRYYNALQSEATMPIRGDTHAFDALVQDKRNREFLLVESFVEDLTKAWKQKWQLYMGLAVNKRPPNPADEISARYRAFDTAGFVSRDSIFRVMAVCAYVASPTMALSIAFDDVLDAKIRAGDGHAQISRSMGDCLLINSSAVRVLKSFAGAL